MKKENSVAMKREVPNTMLPRMEEPERDVPNDREGLEQTNLECLHIS